MFKTTRREFLKAAAMTTSVSLMGCTSLQTRNQAAKPNLVFVFADQWRAQDTGYAGNPDVLTPHLDRMKTRSVNFANAVSCCSVCSPFRASLITGQYPLTHGLFLNDLRLNTHAVSIAQAFKEAGYTTGYIGKWHLDGSGRDAYIPPQRRQGFEFWKVLECTHAYNRSEYYAGDSDQKLIWPGYDTYAQTDAAISYIRQKTQDDKPFALFLSLGPPHNPYRTGPKKWLAYYDACKLAVRPNVPEALHEKALTDLAGYYAHCSALDECIGRLQSELQGTGLDRNTVFVFTSDHGDMLYSQGLERKQKPWDESVCVPFLVQCPTAWNVSACDSEAMINTPDIMPTVLSLCGVAIPATVEGHNYSPVVLGRQEKIEPSALILCPSPFGEWHRANGGREYRGVRTARYTYVRTLTGPWLLYDNKEDPYQLNNLCNQPHLAAIQKQLESQLQYWLEKTGDDFVPGAELIRRSGYRVDEYETVGYTNPSAWGQVSRSARQ